jgi:PTS system mannitol-specific IIA component
VSDESTPLTELLAEASINLDASADSRDEAIRLAGAGLLAVGAIDEAYVDAMIDRENSVSTFMGEGVAIPHGTLAAKDSVRKDALSMVRFPGGVDWDGNDVRIAFGIAARGNGHIALLSQLATVLMDPDKAAALRAAESVDDVYALLRPDEDE